MKLHSVRDIDLFYHMNDITDCRTVEYAYRIIRRHVSRNTHTTVQSTMYYVDTTKPSYELVVVHNMMRQIFLLTTSASGICR